MEPCGRDKVQSEPADAGYPGKFTRMTTTSIRFAGLVAPTRDADATDGELLGRFVAHRDGPAFAALVARHGPMVFGVCRRVLGDWHAAEDAFQAAFLVLARRAADVSPPGAVAGWLHGVAFRVARDARRSASRRSRREHTADALPDPGVLPPEDDGDLRNVLDAEVGRLPAKYRDALVACDMEGRPRVPVAEALGIPEGTLSSRLTAARRMLADRLARRGVAPAVVAGVALNGPPSFACGVPRALSASAARICLEDPGAVPDVVAALADGAIRAMTVRKLLPVTLLLLSSTCLLAATTLLPTPRQPTPNPPKAAAPVVVPVPLEPKPKLVGPNRILVFRNGGLSLVDPDGKNEKKLDDAKTEYHPSGARLSPDGKSIAVLVLGPLPPDDGTRGPKRRPASLHVRKLDEKAPGTDLGVQCLSFAWSPDGTQIACSEATDETWQKLDAKHFAIDVKTKKQTKLQVPGSHIITDWVPTERYFVTSSFTNRDNKPEARVALWDVGGWHVGGGTDSKILAFHGRVSPDGKRILFTLNTPPPPGKPGPAKRELAVVDLDTDKMTVLADQPLNADVQGYCWSPDGKRIAYTWRQVHEGRPDDVGDKETESHLVICDADGKNQKTILTEKGKTATAVTLGGVDWR